MIRNPITRAIAALLVVAAAMAVSPAKAGAQDFQVRGQHVDAGYHDRNWGRDNRHSDSGTYYRHRERRYDHGWRNRHGGWRRHHVRVCEPREAFHAALRLGMRHPDIRRVTRHEIVVSGFKYGRRAVAVFDRFSPRCRLVSARGI